MPDKNHPQNWKSDIDIAFLILHDLLRLLRFFLRYFLHVPLPVFFSVCGGVSLSDLLRLHSVSALLQYSPASAFPLLHSSASIAVLCSSLTFLTSLSLSYQFPLSIRRLA